MWTAQARITLVGPKCEGETEAEATEAALDAARVQGEQVDWDVQTKEIK